MRNRDLARRVAAIEEAKAPPPVHHWTPWQKILTADEWQLVCALAARRRRHELPWPDGARAVCADHAERAVLEAALAKEQQAPARSLLAQLMDDLAL